MWPRLRPTLPPGLQGLMRMQRGMQPSDQEGSGEGRKMVGPGHAAPLRWPLRRPRFSLPALCVSSGFGFCCLSVSSSSSCREAGRPLSFPSAPWAFCLLGQGQIQTLPLN